PLIHSRSLHSYPTRRSSDLLKPRKHRINSSIKYTIINSEVRPLFNITSSGEIYTRVGLDREKRSKYAFTVKIEEKHPTTKISVRSEEHTSELQSRFDIVCRL